jgi:hypothetical protein
MLMAALGVFAALGLTANVGSTPFATWQDKDAVKVQAEEQQQMQADFWNDKRPAGVPSTST